MSREILLTQGKIALVDDQDFEWLSQWKWYAARDNHRFYAHRAAYVEGEVRQATVRMHRVIMYAPHGVLVDHRDGDGLNNTRDNLRLCNNKQNCHNQGIAINNKSGYRGVSWETRYGKWRAIIMVDGKLRSLGYHATPEEAAVAYDAAARELHGEFARLNFKETTL